MRSHRYIIDRLKLGLVLVPVIVLVTWLLSC